MDLHLIPCGLLHALTEQLKLKGSLFGLLADFLAYLLALYIDLFCALNINNEIIALEAFNFGNFFVLGQKLMKLLSDGI